MRRELAVAVLFLHAVVPAHADDAMTVARQFCAARLAGAPAALHAMLSDDLRSIVEDALSRNDAIAGSSGADAAPLKDGIPFASYTGGVTSCAPGGHSHADNLDIVDIAYSAVDGAAWTDRLVLKPAGGAWWIDDILFASFPTDTYNGGLRRILADSFDQ